MPFCQTINREKRLVYETWSGTVTSAELAAYWKELVANPDALEFRRTIADIRECTFAFPGTDFDGLIETIVLPALKGRKWTTAIVVAKPAQFGVSRQFQVFAERFSHDSIFSTLAEAEAWMALQES